MSVSVAWLSVKLIVGIGASVGTRLYHSDNNVAGATVCISGYWCAYIQVYGVDAENSKYIAKCTMYIVQCTTSLLYIVQCKCTVKS